MLLLNGMDNKERRAAYDCDITYVTNNELGFDYLRDNMVIYKEQLVQRGLNFAIIDEVDSVLIDEARNAAYYFRAERKNRQSFMKRVIFLPVSLNVARQAENSPR